MRLAAVSLFYVPIQKIGKLAFEIQRSSPPNTMKFSLRDSITEICIFVNCIGIISMEFDVSACYNLSEVSGWKRHLETG